MRTLFLTFLLGTSLAAMSQQFSARLLLVDPFGNMDSVIVGYDNTSTNGIDASFGEADSVGMHWDAPLEAWIIDAGDVTGSAGSIIAPSAFHTKKQIIPTTCDFTKTIKIGIKCDTSELDIYWDTLLFENDACVDGSLFSTQPAPDFNYSFDSPYLFANGAGPFINPDGSMRLLFTPLFSVSYIEEDGEDILLLFLTFSDTASVPEASGVGIDMYQDNEFAIYPNPSSGGALHVDADFSGGKTYTMQIFSAGGSLVQFNSIDTLQNTVQVALLPAGVYYIKVMNGNTAIGVKKYVRM